MHILAFLFVALTATAYASEQITDAELLKIFNNIDAAAAAPETKLKTLSASKIVSDANSTNAFVNRFKYVGSANSRLLSKYSTIALTASKLMMETDEEPDKENAATRLLKYKAPKAYCPNVEPTCEAQYPYRYPDGSCNNLAYTWWGKSEIAFTRVLKPAYEDDVNEPRATGKDGKPLPNPRVIALNVHYPKDKYYDHDIEWTTLLPTFGQFLDHDITLTAAASAYESDQPLECDCSSRNPDCIKFKIPKDDEINYDSQCMATPRSAASYASFSCQLGYREQLNLISAWLDLSQVYGNTAEQSDKLRTFCDGMLKSSSDKDGEYLPIEAENYMAGDVRVNENLMLQSMQTIWMKEHNRIAYNLKKVNPSWQDERLYQEARVINIAEFQNVVYAEFIPQIIGWDWANDADLIPYTTNDYFYGYDEYVNPNVLNEFSTAAFRFGHNLVANFITFRTYDDSVTKVYDWKNWLQPDIGHLEDDGYNQMWRGCIWDPMGLPDGHITNGLFDHIEELPTAGEKGYKSSDFFRLSLPAINILRSRDHGNRPYNDYRRECGLSVAYSFEDLADTISSEDIANLAATYDDVNDIDLWTGGIIERSVKGGVVGPTFACIISRQFRSLKFGDRFYYENGQDADTRLTLAQLSQIKKTSFSRIICDNSEVTYITPDPFRLPLPGYNPLVRCEDIKGLNFNHWREASY